MKNLLIASTEQFGYHTDTYQYCRYLPGDYTIRYVCWDFQRTRIDSGAVHISYVSRQGMKLKRLARYIIQVLREIRSSHYDVIFVDYFYLCSLLRILTRRETMILDIRSGYVRENRILKACYNYGVLLESLFFKHVSIISEGLRKLLRMSKRKCHVLPLGAEEQCDLKPKSFESIHLFYVGTLDDRNLHETVAGFDRFCREMANTIVVSYDIVGFGVPADEEKLKDAIERSGYKHLITFHGRIPHKELKPFLERCNVGVAYIPLKDYFQYQPATKVFEYLLSGMAVLATATEENALVINTSNGVLFRDTPEAFYKAMHEVYTNRGCYDSRAIRNASKGFTWKTIVETNLHPYLDSLISPSNNRQPASQTNRKVA